MLGCLTGAVGCAVCMLCHAAADTIVCVLCVIGNITFENGQALLGMYVFLPADKIIAIVCVSMSLGNGTQARCFNGEGIVLSCIIYVNYSSAVTLYDHVFVRFFGIEGKVLLVVYIR